LSLVGKQEDQPVGTQAPCFGEPLFLGSGLGKIEVPIFRLLQVV
jgi:hypothetical protein